MLASSDRMPCPTAPEIIDRRLVGPALLADPDDDARLLYRHALEEAGCPVTEVSDGREALVKALVDELVAVVTELRLPIIDGFALCEVLRRDQKTVRLPILVVTTETNCRQLERAMRAGADAVLVKPVAPDRILEEMCRLTTMRPILVEPYPIQPATSAGSDPLSASSEWRQERQPTMCRSYARFDTRVPPSRPPALRCPSCDRPLTYKGSHIGGVNGRHPEQWDDFACPGVCGAFEYRQRTRKLRRADPSPRHL